MISFHLSLAPDAMLLTVYVCSQGYAFTKHFHGFHWKLFFFLPEDYGLALNRYTVYWYKRFYHLAKTLEEYIHHVNIFQKLK